MKNIFLISSPLQLLCAIEAVFHFQLHFNHLIIVNRGTTGNYLQINTVIKMFEGVFDRITILEGKDKSLFGWLKKFKQINLVVKDLMIDKIFIGDYHDSLSRHISNKNEISQIYLIDDGWATLLIKKKLVNDKKLYNYRDVIKFIFSRFEFTFTTRKDIKYFTFFDEKILQDAFNHNFDNLTNSIDLKFLDNTLYFIGSPMVEDKVFEVNKYIDAVINYFEKNKFKNIYYLPHRRENEEKIQLLIKKANIEIIKTNMPIELYLLKNEIEPSNIASLYSTALYTLSKLLKRSTIEYIEIDFNDVLSRKEQIKDIYLVLKTIT